MCGELLREFCAENFEHVPAAIAAGASRIELCDNLAVGGTTPGAGVIWKTVEYAHAHGARVMCMARPRGGNFVYTEDELEMMEADIDMACCLGADGVVFGCLEAASDGSLRLARSATERLVEAVRDAAPHGADVTFHMAFDALDPARQLDAVDALAQMGVTRILAHGGRAGTPIESCYERLRELIACAAGRLTILPGGGITYRNAAEVARALGVREVHGTRIVAMD